MDANVTVCVPCDSTKEFVNMGLTAFSLLFLSVLAYAKKENLFDRLFPKTVPRDPKLAKLHGLEQSMIELLTQIQNLTPPASTREILTDDRIRSASRILSDRGPHSGEGELRMHAETGHNGIQRESFTLEKSCGEVCAVTIRPEQRSRLASSHIWDGVVDRERTPSPRRHAVSTYSASRHDSSERKPHIHASTGSSDVESHSQESSQ